MRIKFFFAIWPAEAEEAADDFFGGITGLLGGTGGGAPRASPAGVVLRGVVGWPPAAGVGAVVDVVVVAAELNADPGEGAFDASEELLFLNLKKKHLNDCLLLLCKYWYSMKEFFEVFIFHRCTRLK